MWEVIVVDCIQITIKNLFAINISFFTIFHKNLDTDRNKD